MERCCTRRVTQSKVFVRNVSREHNGTDHPRGQPPHAHVISWQSENNADDTVQNTDENRRTTADQMHS